MKKKSDSLPLTVHNPLPAGKTVGDYRIGMPLGSGGMADVYYATDVRLERPVALKVLRPALASDATYQQRFLQEARAAAALVHPNIVQIYGVGEDGELRYIAQEYIPGSNLREYMAAPGSLARLSAPTTRDLINPNNQAANESDSKVAGDSPAAKASSATSASVTVRSQFGSDHGSIATSLDRQLPIDETLSILLQVLAALSKAASLGIVHRDIKPENIMLTPSGEVKVADFGLARITLGDDPRLTSDGTTLGTPMYMSPEQLEGRPVDIRSDLYSLGVTLYHMLYGRPPFHGDTPLALAMQHVKSQVPDPSELRKAVPESLQNLVLRLLCKSPSERFDHPEQVLDYLHQYRRNDLSEFWPDRVVPIPGVALATSIPMQATQQLKTLLRESSKSNWLVRSGWIAGALAWLALVAWGSSVFSRKSLDADSLFPITQDLYKNVPRLETAKQQYEWALIEKDAKFGRFVKWEAVAQYFDKSSSPMNQLYVGLAQLQLARSYKEVGDSNSALEQLAGITGDPRAPALLQALAWLEQAAVEQTRENRAALKQAVENALLLRERLSQTDLELLERTIQSLPSEIELYWTPSPLS